MLFIVETWLQKLGVLAQVSITLNFKKKKFFTQLIHLKKVADTSYEKIVQKIQSAPRPLVIHILCLGKEKKEERKEEEEEEIVVSL